MNIAGYAACNILDGIVDTKQWSDLSGYSLINPGDALNGSSAAGDGAGGATQPAVLVDVREPSEVKAGAIAGAINIPLPQLRARVGELESANIAGVPILVSCAVGLRGYIGSRILMAQGFKDVKNLDGGYKTYSAATATFPTGSSSSK